MMESKGSISETNRFVITFYGPLGWTYAKTPLRKPIGNDFHLWVPEWVNKNGETNEGTNVRMNPPPLAARPYRPKLPLHGTAPRPKPPPGTKRSLFWIYFVLTPVIVLLLYVLSIGPVAMMQSNGTISLKNQFVKTLYTPLGWAYYKTPLHKPLGMYMHLWVQSGSIRMETGLPGLNERVNRGGGFLNSLARVAGGEAGFGVVGVEMKMAASSERCGLLKF